MEREMPTADSLICLTKPLNRPVLCSECGAMMPRGQKVRFVSGSIKDEYYSDRFHYDCFPDPAVIRGVPIKIMDR